MRTLSYILLIWFLAFAMLAKGGSSSLLDWKSATSDSDQHGFQDIVYPYNPEHSWGTRRSHEDIVQLYRAMADKQLANASGVYSVYPASRGNGSPISKANIEHYRIGTVIRGSIVLGNLFRVTNPIGRFKTFEPGNGTPAEGCAFRTVSTASKTAAAHKCRVAVNAGFFNPFKNSPSFGECLGNLVVNGVPVQFPGTQNANFGLLKNGSFVSGYIPLNMIAYWNPNRPGRLTSDFETLISGVVYLVKDGQNFVQASGQLENSSTQTTGSIQTFIEVVTARTAIGHDREGNLLIFATDGATGSGRGMDLYSMADLLIKWGAINAINLDGGGSTTVVRDDLCVNMPTDPCPGLPSEFHCERAVSTIACIVDPISG